MQMVKEGSTSLNVLLLVSKFNSPSAILGRLPPENQDFQNKHAITTEQIDLS